MKATKPEPAGNDERPDGPPTHPIWRCERCLLAIQAHAGTLHVDARAANYLAAASGVTWPAMSIPWHVHHYACDSTMQEDDDYWVEIGRVDTWPKLVTVEAQLLGKSWMHHTNWRALLLKVAEDSKAAA